jgi:menaquinol-cytochrome c reductase iron-sulfur subunit
MADDPDRRGFLKIATCALGGGLGLAAVVPVVRLVVDPAGRQTVTTPKDPIDVGSADKLRVGPSWRKVDVIAPVVRDAWTTARDVVLGAAWLRRPSESKLEALSAVCPHLGCAVGWDQAAGNFLCPCHNSRWTADGALVAATGPAKRGLDPLPIDVVDGRLRLTWVSYKLDTASREPA